MLSQESLIIIAPAFLAGIMIALTHAPLGIEVLKRSIIFIDLAIAQIASLGILVAHVFITKNYLLVQLIALAFALAASIFFHFVEKKMPKEQEAIIGVSYILAASIAILVLAKSPHADSQITQILSGQILFINSKDILLHLPIYIFIIYCWFFQKSMRKNFGFYFLFALAITSSVQLVGVYVVFASLILPALSCINYKKKNIVSWLAGLVAVSLGIILSFIFDFPAGAVLVLSYSFVALGFNFLYFFLKKT